MIALLIAGCAVLASTGTGTNSTSLTDSSMSGTDIIDWPVADMNDTDSAGTDTDITDWPVTDMNTTDSPMYGADTTDAPVTDMNTSAPIHTTDSPVTDNTTSMGMTDAPVGWNATDSPVTDMNTSAPLYTTDSPLTDMNTTAPLEATDSPVTDSTTSPMNVTDSPMGMNVTDSPVTDNTTAPLDVTDSPVPDNTTSPMYTTDSPTDMNTTDSPATDMNTSAPLATTDSPITDVNTTAPMDVSDSPAGMNTTDSPVADMNTTSPLYATDSPVMDMNTSSPISTTDSPVADNTTAPMHATDSPVGMNTTSPMDATDSPVPDNTTSPMDETDSPTGMNTTDSPVTDLNTTDSPFADNTTSPMDVTDSPVGLNTTDSPATDMNTTDSPVTDMNTTDAPIPGGNTTDAPLFNETDSPFTWNTSSPANTTVPAPPSYDFEQERLCLEQEEAGLLANTTAFSGDCCKLYDIGCPARFGCYASSPSTWGAIQQDWCCRAKDMGCAHTCDVPAATMVTRQALYCCDRKGVGCTAEWKEEQARADEEREAQQQAAGVARRNLRLKVVGRLSELVSNPKKVLQRLRWALLAASALLQEDPTRLVVRSFGSQDNTTHVPVPHGWNLELLAEERASVQQWLPSAGRAASVLAVLTAPAEDKLYVEYAITGTSEAAVLRTVQDIDTQAQTGSLGGKVGPEVRTVGSSQIGAPVQGAASESPSSSFVTWLWALLGGLGAVCVGTGIAAVVVHKRRVAARGAMSLDEVMQEVQALSTYEENVFQRV